MPVLSSQCVLCVSLPLSWEQGSSTSLSNQFQSVHQSYRIQLTYGYLKLVQFPLVHWCLGSKSQTVSVRICMSFVLLQACIIKHFYIPCQVYKWILVRYIHLNDDYFNASGQILYFFLLFCFFPSGWKNQHPVQGHLPSSSTYAPSVSFSQPAMVHKIIQYQRAWSLVDQGCYSPAAGCHIQIKVNQLSPRLGLGAVAVALRVSFFTGSLFTANQTQGNKSLWLQEMKKHNIILVKWLPAPEGGDELQQQKCTH